MKSANFRDEFNEFLSSPEVAPPASASESVLAKVHEDLNPSNQKVFFKVLGIHALVSLFTLSICSQFGIRAFPIFDAMKSFMAMVGNTYCLIFCGVVYLGVSSFVFSLSLRPEEMKVIRQHQILQLTLLTGLSLGVFLCLGAEILFVPSVLWIAGSLLGGIISLQLGWALRCYLRKRIVYGN